ncbi:MAG: leucyl aminopeptidase, partial [Staphylothermus sp.]|nr:leucyl aminopeptidase [Staphylothermus sp.]
MTKLEYSATSNPLDEIEADSLVVFVRKDGVLKVPDYVKNIAGKLLDEIIETREFNGEEGEAYVLRITGKFKRVVLAGLGSSPTYESI